jgi:hypothetical protein
MKFKVGDKVKVVRDFERYPVGVGHIQRENGFLLIVDRAWTAVDIPRYLIGGYDSWLVGIERDAELYGEIPKPKQFKLQRHEI